MQNPADNSRERPDPEATRGLLRQLDRCQDDILKQLDELDCAIQAAIAGVLQSVAPAAAADSDGSGRDAADLATPDATLNAAA